MLDDIGRVLQFIAGALFALFLIGFLGSRYGFRAPEIEPTKPDLFQVTESATCYKFGPDEPLLMYNVQGCESVYLSVETTHPSQSYAMVWCEKTGAVYPVLVDRNGDGRID